MLVGPTGCTSGNTVNVTRKWVSTPYVGDDAGANEVHWVYDVSANNAKGDISVKSWHETLKNAHGDLSEFNQFMDDRRSFYVPTIDQYIRTTTEMANKFGFPIQYRQGSSEKGSVYVIEWSNNEGQIFEVLSGTYKGNDNVEFEADSCLFRPLEYLKAYDVVLDDISTLTTGDDERKRQLLPGWDDEKET